MKSMRSHFIILGCLALTGLTTSSVQLLPAQTSPFNEVPYYRHLIVLDNSFSMARRAEAARASVIQLVESGFVGQIKPGDTFGVWTYNDSVNQTDFSAMVWLPGFLPNQIADLKKKLEDVKFARRTKQKTMLETLFKAIERSGTITVFLISDGEEKISGTDFDAFINLRYSKSEVRKLRKQKVPFITVLKATEGRIRGWSVQSSPELIVIPQVPNGKPSFASTITKQPAQSKNTLNSGKEPMPLMEEIQDSDQAPELSISKPIPENGERSRIDTAASAPGEDIENDPVTQETGSSDSNTKETIEEESPPSQEQQPTLPEPVSINIAEAPLPISTSLDKALKAGSEQNTKASTETQESEAPSIPPLQEPEEIILAMSNSQESVMEAEKVDSSPEETPVQLKRVSLEEPKLIQPPPPRSSSPDLGETASDRNSGMQQPDNKGAIAPWPILATGLGLAGIVFAGCAIFLLRKAGFGKNTSLITRSMNDHE